MHKFLTSPLVQWIWLNIFRQQWVLMDRDDMRIGTVTEIQHIDGDFDVSASYVIGWWSELPIISFLYDLLRRSLVMLEWKKQVSFRVHRGHRCFLACDDAFGNRLVWMGKKFIQNEVITLMVGREDANFFLLSFDIIPPDLRPRLELVKQEEIMSGWQKFYNML